MKILDGKKIAEELKTVLKEEIIALKQAGIKPGLAVILAGDDPASRIYVRHKEKTCQELGIGSKIISFPASVTKEELLEKIRELNSDKDTHGILMQLPLPPNIDPQEIVSAISPKKDVDCFHPENIGKMFLGRPVFLPCTPAGIIEILKRSSVKISGAHAVIIGRSQIVGKPLSAMLLNESATVTVCHSKTKRLEFYCRQADILISAVGKVGLITQDMVKPNAVVIDVGINRTPDGKLAGDVDFEKVKEVAGAITPVPGGVGPMTIALLMRNTVKAAQQS